MNRSRLVTSSLLILSSLAIVAQAGRDQRTNLELKLQDKRFPVQAGHCGLKRFSLSTYEISWLKTLPGEDLDGSINHHKMMAAAFETSDPSCLKEYGIVQFIRGCTYDRLRDKATGEISAPYNGEIRDLRGKTVLYHHPAWEVDTVDVDPLYSSNMADSDRLKYYGVAKLPLKLKPSRAAILADEAVFFDSVNRSILASAPSDTKQAFVLDTPTGATFIPNPNGTKEIITNSSLEFKTCIYRVSDVPTSGDPASVTTPASAGGPIHCFEWNSRHSWDGASHTFKDPGQIEEFCTTPRQEIPAELLENSAAPATEIIDPNAP